MVRARQLSMGEGGTPVIDIVLGERRLRAKVEYLAPTLSFKDRGAVWLIAAAVELGAGRVVADSSGNAGTAVAAYAARAGLACEVYAPASTAPGKLAQIAAHGADLRAIDGTRADVAAAAIEAVERSGAFYASHVWNPLFFQGTRGIVDELDPVPDVLVLPVGNGTLVLGAALARRDGMRIVGVRATPGTVAEGIDIAEPPRRTEVAAVVDQWITVTDEEILAAQTELARQGLFVEPTGAVAAAAVGHLRDVDPAADVVIPLTGAGLKGLH